MKPLGHRAYGSIPHLPGSRTGPGDYHISEGQCKIATLKARDKHDIIIVQEKLDGSNCSVAKLNGKILALTRAGYLAESSQYKQHHLFKEWVEQNEKRFLELLEEGERACGEWLIQAHGTKYELIHEPFVVFDIMTGTKRITHQELIARVLNVGLITPCPIHIGGPLSVESAMDKLTKSNHGALEEVEGAVWRVERKGVVDFLCKYVRHSKIDGKYLIDGAEVYNAFKES